MANIKETEISSKLISLQQGNLLPNANLSSEYFLTNQNSELNDYQAINSSIQVYLPIWQNGKLKTAVNQSKAGYEASMANFMIDRENLVYQVYETYVNYLRSKSLAELSDIMTSSLAITVDAAKERLNVGISRRSDLLKAQTEYSNSRYLSIQAETAKSKIFGFLLQISGFALDSNMEISDSLEDYPDNLEIISSDSLYNLADLYLPEFKLILKRIEQQDLSRQIEYRNIYPEIGAFGSYNYLKTPVYDGKFYGNIGLSLKMDLFTGWKRKNKIAIEKIKSQQLTLEEQETKRLVYTEIRQAQFDLSEAREKINNAKIQVESSKESFQTINQQYLNGLSSMLELIDAQYADFRANQNYINALADYYLAAVLLKRKTGLLAFEYCKQ